MAQHCGSLSVYTVINKKQVILLAIYQSVKILQLSKHNDSFLQETQSSLLKLRIGWMLLNVGGAATYVSYYWICKTSHNGTIIQYPLFSIFISFTTAQYCLFFFPKWLPMVTVNHVRGKYLHRHLIKSLSVTHLRFQTKILEQYGLGRKVRDFDQPWETSNECWTCRIFIIDSIALGWRLTVWHLVRQLYIFWVLFLSWHGTSQDLTTCEHLESSQPTG